VGGEECERRRGGTRERVGCTHEDGGHGVELHDKLTTRGGCGLSCLVLAEGARRGWVMGSSAWVGAPGGSGRVGGGCDAHQGLCGCEALTS
jgi:hypothetical protein